MIQLLRAYVRAACLREAAQSKTEGVPALVSHARKLTQAIPEIDGWDRATTRYMPDSVDPKQAKAMFAALQNALKAWSAAMDAAEQLDTENPENLKLYSEIGRNFDELQARHDDNKDEVEALKATADKRSKQSAAVTAKGLRLIGTAQIKTIFNAARRTYTESDAMLVDDALAGAKSASKQYGIAPFVDTGWFPIMYSYIRRHSTWEALLPRDVTDMVEYANEDIERYGKNARTARRGGR